MKTITYMYSFLDFILSTIIVCWFQLKTKMSADGPATWITPFSRIQATFQTFFRPGVWCPLIKKFHSHKEKWIMPSTSNRSNMENILRGLMTVIQNDKSRSFWVVKQADPTFIQVQVFTRFEWLDVIEFKINDSNVEVWAFSSGLFPLWIPCVCFVNLIFFWFPFLDMCVNRRRIRQIYEAMDMGIQRI